MLQEATHSEAAMSGSVPADGAAEPAEPNGAAGATLDDPAAPAAEAAVDAKVAAAASEPGSPTAPAAASMDTAAAASGSAELPGEAVSAGEGAEEVPPGALASGPPAGEAEEAGPEPATAVEPKVEEMPASDVARDAAMPLLAAHPPDDPVEAAGAEPEGEPVLDAAAPDAVGEAVPAAEGVAAPAVERGAATATGAPNGLATPAVPLPVEAAGGLNADVIMHSAEEEEPESPDEVPLNGEGGLGAEQSIPTVAGVPQVAPRSGAAAPAIAIPIGGVHAAAEPAEAGGGGAAGGAALSVHVPGPALPDGTMLAEHPPLTPVHPEGIIDRIAEDGALPDALQGGSVEAGGQASGDAAGAAPAAPGEPAHTAAGTGVVEASAEKASPGKAGAAVAVHSQPAKVSARGRRGRGASAAAATPPPAAAEEAAVPAATGMRTRGRGSGHAAAPAGGQDEATQIRGYVMQVMQGFDHPERTLVRELRLAMERQFGVQLNTFMARKDDVADALGEFFMELGYAEKF